MLVSVVMPTLNSGPTISTALQSIAVQDHPYIELIIVDGGSEDDTLSIVEEYKKKIPITILKNTSGLVSSLNQGFSFAHGEIYSWLNSDDYYVSQSSISAMVNIFHVNKCDYVIGESIVVNNQGAQISRIIPALLYGKKWGTGINVFTGSLFFAKEIYNSFGGFSGKYKYSFEYELLYYLILHGKICWASKVIAAFCPQLTSISVVKRSEMVKERVSINNESYFTSPGPFQKIYAYLKRGVLVRAIMNQIIK